MNSNVLCLQVPAPPASSSAFASPPLKRARVKPLSSSSSSSPRQKVAKATSSSVSPRETSDSDSATPDWVKVALSHPPSPPSKRRLAYSAAPDWAQVALSHPPSPPSTKRRLASPLQQQPSPPKRSLTYADAYRALIQPQIQAPASPHRLLHAAIHHPYTSEPASRTDCPPPPAPLVCPELELTEEALDWDHILEEMKMEQF